MSGNEWDHEVKDKTIEHAVKMYLLPKAIYRFDISVKIPMILVIEL